MWIVFDWAATKAFGPFDSRAKAIDWLDAQGIADPDQYELSLHQLGEPEKELIDKSIK